MLATSYLRVDEFDESHGKQAACEPLTVTMAECVKTDVLAMGLGIETIWHQKEFFGSPGMWHVNSIYVDRHNNVRFYISESSSQNEYFNVNVRDLRKIVRVKTEEALMFTPKRHILHIRYKLREDNMNPAIFRNENYWDGTLYLTVSDEALQAFLEDFCEETVIKEYLLRELL